MHNVCKTCGGVSETPGVCTTEGCAHNGQDLKSCDCTDGKHGMGESEGMGGEEATETPEETPEV